MPDAQGKPSGSATADPENTAQPLQRRAARRTDTTSIARDPCPASSPPTTRLRNTPGFGRDRSAASHLGFHMSALVGGMGPPTPKCPGRRDPVVAPKPARSTADPASVSHPARASSAPGGLSRRGRSPHRHNACMSGAAVCCLVGAISSAVAVEGRPRPTIGPAIGTVGQAAAGMAPFGARPPTVLCRRGGLLGEGLDDRCPGGYEDSAGTDMRGCRRVVGTSAGSIVAANLAAVVDHAGRGRRRPARFIRPRNQGCAVAVRGCISGGATRCSNIVVGAERSPPGSARRSVRWRSVPFRRGGGRSPRLGRRSTGGAAA